MLAEPRITPLGARHSFAPLIPERVSAIAQSPLLQQVHAMGTALEGQRPDILQLLQLLQLLERAHALLREHAARLPIETHRRIEDEG